MLRHRFRTLCRRGTDYQGQDFRPCGEALIYRREWGPMWDQVHEGFGFWIPDTPKKKTPKNKTTKKNHTHRRVVAHCEQTALALLLGLFEEQGVEDPLSMRQEIRVVPLPARTQTGSDFREQHSSPQRMRDPLNAKPAAPCLSTERQDWCWARQQAGLPEDQHRQHPTSTKCTENQVSKWHPQFWWK